MADYKIGLQASIDGFAHEHIVTGLLMKKYGNVSMVDLPLSKYDIIIAMKKKDGTEEVIKAQVKTAKKSVPFKSGGRGGVDRTYKSDVKTYKHSTKTCDIIIGVHSTEDNIYELYFVPTILIEQLNQSSISIKKIEKLKNNYEIFEHCKNKVFVIKKCKEYNLI